MQTTNYKGFSRSQVNALIDTYILNSIPSAAEIKSSWGKEIADTDTERINFAMSCYESEYNNEYNKRLYPNEQKRLKEWLMGLPSAMNIDFENYRILQLAREWGTLEEIKKERSSRAIERMEDTIINQWFDRIAFRIIRLHEKLNGKQTEE